MDDSVLKFTFKLQGRFRSPMSSRLPSVFTLLLLIAQAPSLHAQTIPEFHLVIDGTQNPPQVITGDIDVAITDNGTGNYTLVFDDPVDVFLGSSLTKGPGFDVGSSFLTAIQDSLNRNRLQIKTWSVNVAEGHSPMDALFSIKIVELPIFINGFEN